MSLAINRSITPNLRDDYIDVIKNYRIKTNRTPLKDASIKLFVNNYNIIYNLMEVDTWEEGDFFLLYKDEVFKALEKNNVKTGKPISNSTKRNYLNSVITWAEAFDLDKDVIAEYSKSRDDYNLEYNKKVESGEWMNGEKELYLPRETIELELKGVEKLLRSQGIFNSTLEEIIQSGQLSMYQYWVMMHMYMKHPLRNDLHEIQIVHNKAYDKKVTRGWGESKKEYDVFDKTKNYLIKEGQGFFLLLNDFKTNKAGSGVAKKIIIEDKPLLKIMRKFIKITGAEGYLFTVDGDKPFTTNQFTQFLQKWNKTILGKPIGTRMMRKIFYTDKYDDEIIDELQKDADNNLHSISTAVNIYKKEKPTQTQS